MGLLDGRVAIVTGSGRGSAGSSHCASPARRVRVVNDVGVSLDGRDREDPAAEVCREIEALGSKARANYDSVTDFDGAATSRAPRRGIRNRRHTRQTRGIVRDKTS